MATATEAAIVRVIGDITVAKAEATALNHFTLSNLTAAVASPTFTAAPAAAVIAEAKENAADTASVLVK